MTGIASVGAYAPRYRLTAEAVEEAWGQFHGAGISETAVPAGDEDALTMAHEAAALALAAGDVDADEIGALLIGTTTPPYEEEAIPPRLASTLGLGTDLETRQFTGSTRAGLEALVTGLEFADEPTLVVASDAPRGAPDDEVEHAGGAGAAAVVLAPDGPGAVTDTAEHVSLFPGTRFRPRGSEETTGLGVTGYDRQAFTETVAAAADALEGDLADADAVCLQSPNGKLPYRAAGDLGVDTDALQAGTTVHDLGDTGAASVLLGLASALEDGHTDLGLIGYGSGGGATAARLAGEGVAVRTRLEGVETLSYGEYLRMRGDVTPGEPDGGGAYVSVPSWKRTIPQRHRLVAGRCEECGSLAFPPEGACTECGAFEAYDEVSLPGTGTVEAATVIGQGGAPPEFVEQQAREGAYVSAVVALDGPGGDRDEAVSTPTQVLAVGDENVDVGDRVEATIRRIYTQEGVTRYGFKMRLADA
ncbi:zinc ribbon domain-containing protein [Natrialbaceae archaeon AArc-T1-2]|uniref:zinc ribbon domain-containing protein n=1 Tax=Natrialbaceae archaeon AArc-T1-2 TaxID=3053904 RepID=UPI00255ACA53|nr:zinc ribbon domain-containing protein [Natrialbaceae archaeon AArc-T1-2]WIV66981.1 zinc ribbon domain-containing protein [Natrialbaceae archaeon AArc-T1-2]